MKCWQGVLTIRACDAGAWLTVVQSLGLSLQGHARRIGLNAAAAATHALGPVQRHHNVAQFCCTERATMDQLVVLDDPATYTCSFQKTHTHTKSHSKTTTMKKKKKKLLNLLLKSYYSSCCLNLFVFKIFCISSALWCTLCMQIRFKLILLNTTFTLSYYTQIQHLTFFDAPFQPPNKYKYISLLV